MAELAFGRYQVVGELGRGAMAIVYLAEDTVLQRKVALKALTQQYAAESSFRERFQREGRILARAQHDSIVPIFDFGEERGAPYLVMKMMAGGTLADRLAHGPLTPDRAFAVLTRVASALDAAHAAGVIHRDLKPANVLFDERDNAFVADFGVGRMDGASSGVTQPGTVIGTAQYMSPEQVRGAAPSNASDIYSFGALAYETLTGRPPFEGADVWVVMRRHLEDPPPRPSEGRPWLAFADSSLLAALAKAPEERPATATAVVEGLRSGSAPVPAYQPTPTARSGPPPSPAPPPPRSAPVAASAQPATPVARPSPAPAAPPPVRAMPTPMPVAGSGSPPLTPPRTEKRPFWRHPLFLAIGGGALTAGLVSVVLAAALGGDEKTSPDPTPFDTSTPTGTPTETPTPTITPTPGPGVFLEESFESSATSVLVEFDDESGSAMVETGELHLYDRADDGRLVWVRWAPESAKASIQLRGFADVNVLTMACDDGVNQIRASVSSRTGSYKVVNYNIDLGEFTTYIDWTNSPAVLTDQKSALQLLCEDTRMSFIINGETVAAFDIASTSANAVWVAADGGVNSSVYIDDLVITTLP